MSAAIAIAIACAPGLVCAVEAGEPCPAAGWLYTAEAHEQETRAAAALRVRVERQADSLRACRADRDEALAARLSAEAPPVDPPRAVAWYALGAAAAIVPAGACYVTTGEDYCASVGVTALAIGAALVGMWEVMR